MADKIRILVVDDEAVIITGCKRILESEGYHVESALGGKEAISLMEQNQYDFVITDLKMPEVDGLTLIKWIKISRPDTGILIITGYPSQDSIKEALEIGIIDYIPKPFTPSVLLDVVTRAIDWKKTKIPEDEKPPEEFPPSMINEIERVIGQYKNKPGNTIPVLQRCQQIVGYLPPQIQKRISKGLNVPTAELHSIVSFYSYFTMKPRGDHNIRVCLGTACYVKRVEESLTKIKEELGIDVGDVTEDRKFSLETVRCLGACGLAPVIVVDEETFGAVNPKKVSGIIEQYA